MDKLATTIKSLILFIFLVISSQVIASDFEISLSDRNLSDQQAATISQFLRQLEERLPPLLKASLARRSIEVRFQRLNRRTSVSAEQYCERLSENISLAQRRHNRMQILNDIRPKEVIRVDLSLIDFITNPRSVDCSHRRTDTIAMGYLIRELALIFDDANVRLGLEREYVQYCQQYSRDELNRLRRNCRDYLQSLRSVSDSPYFKNISGWIKRGMVRITTRNLNHYVERAIHPLELESTRSSLAINLEKFLLDPQYQCRRPTMNDYFRNLFRYDPFERDSCEMNTIVTVFNQQSQRNPITYQNLDPSRLYQVQYLFASKGERMASRWGHSLFKLVFCAPHREEVGPDCLYDRAYHIVLNFRANVEDLEINYMDGLLGNYDSIMLIQPLGEVVDEYNKGEFRDLISLPMNLTQREMHRFVYAALEIYWAYKGRYYFISNNCATEALTLMKMSMPRNFNLQHRNILTPLGLYNRYIRNGLFDNSVIEDLDEARDKGYFFPAFNSSLQRSFDAIKEFSENLERKDMADYSSLRAEQRKEIFQQVLENASQDQHTRLISNMIRLEDHMQRTLNGQIQQKAFEEIMKNDDQSLAQDQEELLLFIQAFRALQAEASSENNVQQGYGIPLSHEFQQLESNQLDQMKGQYLDLFQQLAELIQLHLPDDFEQIRKTAENRVWLIEALMNSTGLAQD